MAERTGAVHDLGYKRYEGARTPQRARLGVIARNVLGLAIKGWWRAKVWFILAAITVFVASALLYVWTFVERSGKVPFMTAGGREGLAIDIVVPGSFDFLTALAFVLGMTVVAGTVASDLRAGAFEFYFSKPVRPWDYVLGKLLGCAAVIGVPLLVAPLLIALVQVALSLGGGGTANAIADVGRVVIGGAIATAVYTALPLALGATTRKKAYSLAVFAVFYVVIGSIPTGIAMATGIPELAALDPKQATMSVIYGLHDIQFMTAPSNTPGGEVVAPLGLAIAAIAVEVAAAVAFLRWRVARAERAGLGGG